MADEVTVAEGFDVDHAPESREVLLQLVLERFQLFGLIQLFDVELLDLIVAEVRVEGEKVFHLLGLIKRETQFLGQFAVLE